jgi:hypothetical protein
MSNCSHPFRPDSNLKTVSSIRPYLLDLHISSVKLVGVNCGAGTTGTKSLNLMLCRNFGLRTVHYDQICNLVSDTNSIINEWPIDIIMCVNQNVRCSSLFILNRYPMYVQTLLSNFEFASDFPIGEILPDLLTLVRNISILSTMRDSRIWTQRRLHDHSNTPICHPSLWNRSTVNHPFDIINCLELVNEVKDGLVPIRHFHQHPHLIQRAYERFMSFTLNLAHSYSLPYLSLCMWDRETSHDNAHFDVRNHWCAPTSSSPLCGRYGQRDSPLSLPGPGPGGRIGEMKRTFSYRLLLFNSMGGQMRYLADPPLPPDERMQLTSLCSFLSVACLWMCLGVMRLCIAKALIATAA